MDQLRKTETDELLKKELANGKLMIGESAGALYALRPFNILNKWMKSQRITLKKIMRGWI